MDSLLFDKIQHCLILLTYIYFEGLADYVGVIGKY
jgi:hypothetical protein